MSDCRWLLAVALLGATSSSAQPSPAEIVLKNQVPAGQKPSLTLKALVAITGARLEVRRAEDGRTFTVEHGALRPGQSATIDIGDGKTGHARWKGLLSLVLADGSRSTQELTFESGTVGELRVVYDRAHLDLGAQRLAFQLSRPAGKASLVVYDDTGAELGRGQATYHGEKPGTWLTISWNRQERDATVMRLELHVEAVDGLAATVKLTPWSVSIPHEEIVFATNVSAIAPSEEAKLDASYQKIIDAMEKARHADPTLPVRVYVAGHTDTVGGAEDNRKLSLARARSIAAFFRDRGLPLPLFYAGLGEDAPRVKTADNTEEARNRRADYIVAVEEPDVARGVRPRWTELR